MSKRQRDRKAKQLRHTRKARAAIGTGAAIGLALGAPAVGHAATTFNVNTTNDAAADGCTTAPNGCTLRDAITDANATKAPADITFDSGVTGTINLTDALPTLNYPISIHGPGASTLTVHQTAPNKRVFTVFTDSPNNVVNISGLTVSGGNETDGGGIYSKYATLNLDHVVVTGNNATGTSGFGGGVFTSLGALTVNDSTIENNTAPGTNGKGAGIGSTGQSADTNTSVTINRSTIAANHANGTNGIGGGIATNNVQLAINDSSISGNTSGTDGGGLATQDLKRSTSIDNSTISGNTAGTGQGGGIYSVTYAGNTTRPFTIDSSTLAFNDAEAGGGGIAAYSSGSGANAPGGVLNNTIVGRNSSTSGEDDIFRTGPVDPFAASFTLVQAAPASGILSETVAGSNILGQDPMLGSLTNNGGPTLTRAPQPLSPVLDKGSTRHNCDQRGFSRPIDQAGSANSTAAGADASDMGAVEVGGSPASSCGLEPLPQPPPQSQPQPIVQPQPGPTFGKLSTGGVKVGANSVSIVLTCASANCSGVLNLFTTEKLKGNKVVGLSKKKARKKRLKVGSKAYALTSGQTKRITVKLNSKGKKLLKKFRKLPVKLAVTQKQLNGKSVTIKNVKRTIKVKKKKRK